MGQVYKAYHPQLERTVAIKVRHASKGGSRERSRFLAEAQMTASLHHPNIVGVHDVGTQGECDYLVMDFIAGKSLEEALRKSRMPVRKALEIMVEIARAVAYAHQQGIIHRDLKPANIMLQESDNRPIVMDFGLAKNLKGDIAALSQSGELLGTPLYMAPEQAAGRVREISARTDVYALGAILYEMVSGVPAIDGTTPMQIFYNIAFAEVLPLRKRIPRLSRELEVVCAKALDKDPRFRYASAQEFADDIDRLSNGEAISALPLPAWRRAWRSVCRHKGRSAITLALLLFVIQGAIWLSVKQQENSNIKTKQSLEKTKLALEEAQSLVEQEKNILVTEMETINKTGAANRAKGDHDAAIAQFNKTIETLAPKLSNAYAHRGAIHRLNRNYDKSLADCNIALALFPRNRIALRNRGVSRYYLRDYDGAIADCTCDIGDANETAVSYTYRGASRFAKGDDQGGLEDCNNALRINERQPETYHYRGRIYWAQNKRLQAMADFNKLLELAPHGFLAEETRKFLSQLGK